MRVLMISLDRTLLGADNTGDVLERHQEYAQEAGQLDIIVFSKAQPADQGKGFKKRKVSPQLTIYPTNSSNKIAYFFDAYNIAKDIYWPRFDLIVCQDPFLTGLAGWLLKKRFKLPLLIHFHGDFWQNKYWLWERWFNPVLLFLSKFLVDGADGIRVVSSEIKKKLIQEGVDKKKIRVIPTPVNIGKFRLFDLNKIKKLKKEHQYRKTIINVGLRDPLAKDYPTLFKAVSLVYEKCRNLAFWQVGADFYLPEKIRTDDNLLLIGEGSVKQDDLINYYYASDIYVSSSRHESLGKVLIEAMVAGLPVVATATTGSKDIIEDGETGFLVSIGDSQALAKRILYLLNNPEKAKEMGKAGRKMVKERFDRQKIMEEIINFWQELI